MIEVDGFHNWWQTERGQKILTSIYGDESQKIKANYERYEQLLREFAATFGRLTAHIFSSPGRTELSGNHTDHNHGRVLAASVDLDSIAAVCHAQENVVTLFSESFPEPFIVNLDDLAPHREEKNTTSSLIRGIAARFNQLGYEIGGFNAYLTSDVLVGSGLSSSASIEVLIGEIFNVLYNEGKIPPIEIAKIGQYAENEYFGKPCGLMDQIACAVGGIVAIDFETPAEPIVEKIEFDFLSHEYSLLVIDTGGSHADLTEHYGAIPAEMKAVAKYLGFHVAREIPKELFLKKLPHVRKALGDRAALRVFHFINENERVMVQKQALKEGNLSKFLELVNKSGQSSNKWLQNSYAPNNFREQGINIALALTEDYLEKIGAGACRVHGGGFAGTIQVFLPRAKVEPYKIMMENVFGKDSVKNLMIRPLGVKCLTVD